MMKGPLAGLMQQAQKMQEAMQKAQQELEQAEVTGSAGGGLAQVVMSGRHEVRRVHIDRQVLAEDPEMAEDLIAAAFNDAVNRVAELTQQRLGGMAAGLGLPGGIKLPF